MSRPRPTGGPTIDGTPAELRLEFEALRASRARVVAGADAERRLIERELHDGVQQHLVALVVNLQLARQLVESDSPAATALLEEIGADAREALEGVRALADRIYPALLPARGLGDALHAVAAASGVPFRVEAAGLDRYAPEVEAAVYFCCVEAVANVAAHAGAGACLTVRSWREDGAVLFEVSDDGTGFEPELDPPGGGLARMSDRLGALEGRLAVSSAPGRGTVVRGTVPLPR